MCGPKDVRNNRAIPVWVESVEGSGAFQGALDALSAASLEAGGGELGVVVGRDGGAVGVRGGGEVAAVVQRVVHEGAVDDVTGAEVFGAETRCVDVRGGRVGFFPSERLGEVRFPLLELVVEFTGYCEGARGVEV